MSFVQEEEGSIQLYHDSSFSSNLLDSLASESSSELADSAVLLWLSMHVHAFVHRRPARTQKQTPKFSPYCFRNGLTDFDFKTEPSDY